MAGMADPPPAAEEDLLGCAHFSLDSLDQTARDLLATGNPDRSGPKQVRADRGKCSLATTTHHSQKAGLASGLYENGSAVPRVFSQAGSNLEPLPDYRPARDEALAGIRSASASIGRTRPRPILTDPTAPP